MRTVAALIAAALSLAASHAAPRGGGGSAREDPAPRIAGVEAQLWSLLSPRSSPKEPDEAAIAKQVAALGSEVAGPAIALYLGGLEEPDHDYPLDARAVDARPRILLAALRLLPRPAVLEGIDAAAQRWNDDERRLALARVLGELGGEKALRRLVGMAAELDPIQWNQSLAQVQLEQGITGIVREDPRLARFVAQRIREEEPALAAILARALVGAGSWQVAEDLAHAFGRDPKLDLCLASALATLGVKAEGTFPDAAFAALRRCLDSNDPGLVRAAATALGRLGDEACAERLAQLLDELDPLVRAAARSALVTLGGTELPPERRAWEDWLAKERAWSLERLPEIESICAEGDPAKFSAALYELSAHRLYRHRAAQALLPTLVHQNSTVVCLACRALPGFGSRAVVPVLRAFAREGDPEIRAAAAWALHELTGESAAAGTAASRS